MGRQQNLARMKSPRLVMCVNYSAGVDANSGSADLRVRALPTVLPNPNPNPISHPLLSSQGEQRICLRIGFENTCLNDAEVKPLQICT